MLWWKSQRGKKIWKSLLHKFKCIYAIEHKQRATYFLLCSTVSLLAVWHLSANNLSVYCNTPQRCRVCRSERTVLLRLKRSCHYSSQGHVNTKQPIPSKKTTDMNGHVITWLRSPQQHPLVGCVSVPTTNPVLPTWLFYFSILFFLVYRQSVKAPQCPSSSRNKYTDKVYSWTFGLIIFLKKLMELTQLGEINQIFESGAWTLL